MYDINEADAAIQFAIHKGYPAQWFIPLYHTALSTREEAVPVLDALKQRNIHSFLLVTSDITLPGRGVSTSAWSVSAAAGRICGRSPRATSSSPPTPGGTIAKPGRPCSWSGPKP